MHGVVVGVAGRAAIEAVVPLARVVVARLTADAIIGTYGNSPRNFIIGPGLINTDFSAIKDFKIMERARLQFRSEFFNVFNNVNFSPPVSTASSSTFGRITAAGPSRVIQFALKLLW